MIRHVDREHRKMHSSLGERLPSDLTDAQWARLEPLIPAAKSGRTSAQDRHARGDERDLLSAADRLSLALSAPRTLSAALDGLQHLPQVPARGSLGGDLGELLFALREAGRPGGQPDRRDHRQPVAEVSGKRGL